MVHLLASPTTRLFLHPRLGREARSRNDHVSMLVSLADYAQIRSISFPAWRRHCIAIHGEHGPTVNDACAPNQLLQRIEASSTPRHLHSHNPKAKSVEARDTLNTKHHQCSSGRTFPRMPQADLHFHQTSVCKLPRCKDITMVMCML